jgi:hypothetical protein
MKKIFRYSRIYYLVLLLVCFPAFILVKGFLYEAFPVENYIYSIVLVFFITAIISFLIHILRGIAMTIATDENTIEIRKPFKSVKWNWEEISEFGKLRRIAYHPGGGGYWVYYIKGGLGNKKIILGSKGLKNLEDLVPYILFKAYKAKIVNIQKAEKIEN